MNHNLYRVFREYNGVIQYVSRVCFNNNSEFQYTLDILESKLFKFNDDNPLH